MRFIGCKTNLLEFIKTVVDQSNIKGKTFCDLFAGTASVGKYFKKFGYKIESTDLLFFSYVLQRTYIQLNKYPQFKELIKMLDIKSEIRSLYNENNNAQIVINYLNELDGINGFIYSNYSPEGTQNTEYIRKYFTENNAKKIDAIREQIEKWQNSNLLTEDEYYFLISSLIEAVPFVSNISGTYAAFLKNWDNRAFKNIKLKVPIINNNNKKNIVKNMNGVDYAINEMKNIDILYLDPPYNERQYAPNYHILETIARWDFPKIKGVTGMRDYKEQKSEFCNYKTGLEALKKIVKAKNYKYLLLSYNDDGIMPEEDIINILSEEGKLEVFQQDYQRYKSNGNGNQKKKVQEKIYLMKRVHPNNKLNDLNGGEWTYFLNSVLVTNYSTKGKEGFAFDIRKKHPSPKPPQLMKTFIEFFTKEQDLVFDPFMGAGSTLIASSLSNRKAIGIDLSEEYINLYEEVCDELGLEKQKVIIGDSLNLHKLLDDNTIFDFILTDPPYGEMLSKKRTGERQKKTGVSEATPFTDNKNDLGNMNREEFLNSLHNILCQAVDYLKPRGYLAVFTKDFQPKQKEHNMLHLYITEKLLEIPSLSFRGYKIWYDATQKLYPFGYPHAFVANQFHQYILIFRKEE